MCKSAFNILLFLIFFAHPVIFAASGEASKTAFFPTEGTPQKAPPRTTLHIESEPQEPTAMVTDELRLSKAEIWELIKEQDLPPSINPYYFGRSLLQLAKEDIESIDRYCAQRQLSQIKELESLDLKQKWKKNKADQEEMEEAYYDNRADLKGSQESLIQQLGEIEEKGAQGDTGYLQKKGELEEQLEKCNGMLKEIEEMYSIAKAGYLQEQSQLEQQLSEYRLTSIDVESCFAFTCLQQSELNISSVLHPFLLKARLLRIARLHIMSFQRLFEATHHPLVAKAAIDYFMERHEPNTTRKVQPEDITFVHDIYRYNPELRDWARMVAKIFARFGAISPVNCFSLYFGNANMPMHTLAGLPRIAGGLIQLANSYSHEELNAVVNDYFRNHVSLITQGDSFGKDVVADLERVLFFLYLIPSHLDVTEKRITNLRNLKNLIEFIKMYVSLDFSHNHWPFKMETPDPLEDLNDDVMRNGYYKESDFQTLCTAADSLNSYRKTALLKYLEFVERCFPSDTSIATRAASSLMASLKASPDSTDVKALSLVIVAHQQYQ